MSRIHANLIAVMLCVAAPSARADNPFHQAPFDYLFGNHFDTHQETRLDVNRQTGAPVELQGKFYIILTGATDPASGLPIARHPRGAANNEACGVDVKCVVGWELRGLPGAAKFVSHTGVNGEDHPIWLVNRAEEPAAPAPGMVIPQPGYYSHFMWITRTSTDPRAASVPDVCDKNDAGELERVAVDQVCQGWFLQIKAKRKFAFEHGGEIIPIENGEDLRSHLNIVTNYKSPTQPAITTTRD